MADADTSNMYVFGACCCCNSLLSDDFAKFIGCSGVSECLCIREEFCCKANTDPMPCVVGPADGFIVKIGAPCCSCGLKVPDILLKGKSQCFCLTSNAALPPDADTPMMFAVYGLSCFPQFGCCLKMSEVSGAAPAAAAAPAAQA
jgi:hypothetical protein